MSRWCPPSFRCFRAPKGFHRRSIRDTGPSPSRLPMSADGRPDRTGRACRRPFTRPGSNDRRQSRSTILQNVESDADRACGADRADGGSESAKVPVATLNRDTGRKAKAGTRQESGTNQSSLAQPAGWFDWRRRIAGRTDVLDPTLTAASRAGTAASQRPGYELVRARLRKQARSAIAPPRKILLRLPPAQSRGGCISRR